MAKGITRGAIESDLRRAGGRVQSVVHEVHGSEVMGLPGFASMTRYKVTAQVVPPADPPRYSYLAFYELDDIDLAVRALAGGELAMSDSVDLGGALGMAFEKVYSTKD